MGGGGDSAVEIGALAIPATASSPWSKLKNKY